MDYLIAALLEMIFFVYKRRLERVTGIEPCISGVERQCPDVGRNPRKSQYSNFGSVIQCIRRILQPSILVPPITAKIPKQFMM